MKQNYVKHIGASGGIVGLFRPRHKALAAAVEMYNKNGWRVVQVVDADRANLFVMMLSLMVLCWTCFIWTFLPGYVVIFEHD